MAEVDNSSLWKQVLSGNFLICHSDLRFILVNVLSRIFLLRYGNMKKRFCSCGDILATIQ